MQKISCCFESLDFETFNHFFHLTQFIQFSFPYDYYLEQNKIFKVTD